MDLEENLGFISLITERIRQEQIFENQLRDIDNALNLSPPNMVSLPKPLTPLKSNLSPSQYTTRVALGDVTNTAVAQPKEQKAHSVKKSWKKLARAQGNSEDNPLDPVHIKKSSHSLDDDNLVFLFSKKQCGVNNSSISAEAAIQSRRQP